ncbi:MAG TPA: tetratricopeptide repeat protein [Stellaceae bacterium]|nr:tetratricopeptide repeat protein [Stellaceae bacterium]
MSGPRLYGDYLAGRQAQHRRDFANAAKFYEKALAAHPDSPELISRTFLMEVFTGNFERAATLARRELKRDPNDAVAHLVMVVDRLKSGESAGAIKAAAALPSDGVHRFVAPFALSWTRMAAGDLAGAETALQGLDKFNGFEPLKVFQLGLLYDYAGKPDKARQFYEKAIGANEQLNWRVTDVVANFEERQGRSEQAQALYDRFIRQNSSSDLATAVAAIRSAGPAKPPVTSPADGLAAAMFDLASVLNQPETIDLALLYDRVALGLRPQFPLAQLLLSDILSAQRKPEESLAILREVPKDSPYYWSAQLRAAVNLDTLERTDEAIVQLKAMAAENPNSIGALATLGDILRTKKRFAEAADAYDEAIRRTEAAGLPEKWTLFYDRGVARERSGQWEKAEADLLKALELKPDQPMVLNYLGYSWVDRGENLDRGMKMVEKAVELRPDDGYIVDSLGWAHYRMGDYEAAVEKLEKAVELVPEDPTINDHLGDAYWRIGRLIEARYQWRRALQFGPQENEIKPIEAKIEHGLNTAASPPRGG